ncbi:response regulator, partial [Paenibacillus sepulcri]|nr:response regulator [Paenibacillus sepulcri]
MQLIYNILLVDDEPMHLAGLSNMFHKLRPHYAVYTARNGKEALSFCTEESFQIIITDIQMPMMDGLEFIGSLGDDNNPRKVIFLSGYGNFDYAQKAIGLGSFDYLLKPLDVDQFTHVLEKAERSIETEVRLLEEKRQMEQKLQRVFPVYHQRILNGWLKGEADTPAKQTEVEDILGFGGAGRLLLTDIAYDASRIPQPEASSCKMKIKDAIGDLIGDYGRVCSFFLDQDGSRLITATDAPLSATVLEALSGIS